MAVNAGMSGNVDVPTVIQWKADSTLNTSISRKGNIEGNFYSGNVLIGTGASSGLSIGGITVTKKTDSTSSLVSLVKDLTLTTAGDSIVTLNGDVNYNVNDSANLVAWANAGGAFAVGGSSTAIVNGNSTLSINTKKPQADLLDGIVGLAAVGGTAVSTLGGNATSTVDGNTVLNVNSGLTGLVAGGGAAISLDPSAVYNNLTGKVDGHSGVGNDNDESDTDVKDLIHITFKGVTNGGTADVLTGDSTINLNGDSTAIVTAGGGVAAAWHSYTNRDSTDGSAENNNQPGGISKATAQTGNVTFNVNLKPSEEPNGNAMGEGVKTAITAIQGLVTNNGTGSINETLAKLGSAAGTLSGKGMAVGLLGGGLAVSVSDGGTTASSVVDGVEIKLNSGYVVGTFGGGMAVNAYNKATMPAFVEGETYKQMSATADVTNDVKITVATSDANSKAIGVFAGGVAVSSEYGTQHNFGQTESVRNSLASSTVTNADVTVTGKADGVFGGGLAVGNSNRTEKGFDAFVGVTRTSTITVDGGTVDVLNLAPIMNATQSDTATGGNILGYNASYTMKNLQGITDRTAIAGGGMALGMSAKADVAASEIIVNEGEVKADILGGGIAVDQIAKGEASEGGAHVGTSTITLNGGTVAGSVYAGGAVTHNVPVSGVHGYTSAAKSTVDEAVITLNGTAVAGEISGQGYELTTGSASAKTAAATATVGKSTLNITGSNTLSMVDTATFAQSKLTGSGHKIHSFNAVNVAAKSVTTLEGTIGDVALIQGLADGSSVMTVDNTAVLDVRNATFTGEGKVAEGFSATSTFWTVGNVVYDRFTTLVDVTAQEGSFKIKKTDITDADKGEATKRFVRDLGAEPLKEVIASGYDLNWDVRAGARSFFSDWSANAPTQNAAFGRAALFGEDAAVTANTVAISRTVTDNLTSRLSYIGDFASAPAAYGETGAVWAQYLRNDFKAEGLSTSFGDVEADGDFNGVMAGADFAVVGNVRAGAAVYYVDGDSDGTISSNDYDGWGFSLYGNYRNAEYGVNVIGDLGYGRVSNEIKGHLNGQKLATDRDLNVFTAGVKVEKQFQVAENCYVVPYTGIRFFNVDAKDYDTTYGGEHLFGNDAENQNIWTLPVGVSTKHDFKLVSGWNIAPKIDVAYVWAFGDKDNDVKVDMGTGAYSALNYKVVDDGSWRGALGVDATYGAFGFGLGYSYQKGDDIKDQKWFANMSYAF